MKKQQAESIALQIFQVLADDLELLERFFTLSGLTPQNLRKVATSPGFYIAILEFVSNNESDLLTLAHRAHLDPVEITKARHTLSPEGEFD